MIDFIYNTLGLFSWKVYAACTDFSSIAGGASCAANGTDLEGKSIDTTFSKVTQVLLVIIGIASVIVIIIAGLRMILSQGDPKAFESARNTILYAIIGIVIALLSYAIIGFVLKSIGG
ncbi:hypothetical protein H6792_01410 [Candidatus Nomurabacteria bacterium]|nr:hypothetical protein [Candidatus Nomurabacteria bacterium]